MDLKQIAIELIESKLNGKANNAYGVGIRFKNDAFNFYDDTCGQRLHKVEQYVAYGHKVEGHFRIVRVLSFTNPVDEGKDGAILGVLNVNKAEVVAICQDKIEFDLFTIYWD